MSQRCPNAPITLLMLALLGATAAGLVILARDRAGATPPYIPATPTTAPLIIAQPAGDRQLAPPPTLAELLARHPQLAALSHNLDLSDRAQLARAYAHLVTLYRAEGAVGLHTFMLESGALSSLCLLYTSRCV